MLRFGEFSVDPSEFRNGSSTYFLGKTKKVLNPVFIDICLFKVSRDLANGVFFFLSRMGVAFW